MSVPKANLNKINRDDVDFFALTCGGPNVLDQYQHIAGQSAIYPGSTSPLGLAYCALKLNGEAGEFAEHVGKAMRDDNLAMGLNYDEFGQISGSYVHLTPERRSALIKELGDVLWYVQAAARELGVNLSQVAWTNLEKLCSRGERGKLGGSGDNR